MHNFNALDIAILAILGISVVISFMRGFVREAISLAIWVVAVFVSIKMAAFVGGFYTSFIGSETARYIAGFASVFIAVLILGVFVSMFMSTLVDKTGISSTDRLLGIFFGAARGVLLVAVVLMFMSIAPVQSTGLWQKSQLATQFQGVVKWLEALIPEHVAQQFNNLVGGPISPVAAVPKMLYSQNGAPVDTDGLPPKQAPKDQQQLAKAPKDATDYMSGGSPVQDRG